MTVLLTLLVLVVFYYAWLILGLRKTWLSLPEPQLQIRPISMSLIVVYRNEEKNLHALLDSIHKLDQQWNPLQLIFVDDDSSDRSVEIVNDFLAKGDMDGTNLSLNEKNVTGKKRGIELGISIAKNDVIITTDADCVLPRNWLQLMSSSVPSDFISGPVSYHAQPGLFPKLVQLDLISLSALGGCLIKRNQPILANGANMCFSKSAFLAVGGYGSNAHVQSGDDVFLLQAMAGKENAGIEFCKSESAVVRTEMAQSFKEFINQRIRWAGKTKYAVKEGNHGVAMGLVLSYIAYVTLVISSLVLGDVFGVVALAVGVGVKLTADGLFFRAVLPLFGEKGLQKYVWMASVLHPFYVVIIAGLSMFLPYTWKERRVQHG